MNEHTLLLHFHIADEAFNALEAVLATARRGGLQLSTLSLSPKGGGHAVSIGLLSDEPDRLDLFLARADNIIGVTQLMRAATPRMADAVGCAVAQ